MVGIKNNIGVFNSYLSHSSQESLGVEESSHPESVRSPIKTPRVELCVSLDQLSKPETQCRGLP